MYVDIRIWYLRTINSILRRLFSFIHLFSKDAHVYPELQSQSIFHDWSIWNYEPSRLTELIIRRETIIGAILRVLEFYNYTREYFFLYFFLFFLFIYSFFDIHFINRT